MRFRCHIVCFFRYDAEIKTPWLYNGGHIIRTRGTIWVVIKIYGCPINIWIIATGYRVCCPILCRVAVQGPIKWAFSRRATRSKFVKFCRGWGCSDLLLLIRAPKMSDSGFAYLQSHSTDEKPFNIKMGVSNVIVFRIWDAHGLQHAVLKGSSYRRANGVGEYINLRTGCHLVWMKSHRHRRCAGQNPACRWRRVAGGDRRTITDLMASPAYSRRWICWRGRSFVLVIRGIAISNPGSFCGRPTVKFSNGLKKLTLSWSWKRFLIVKPPL